MSLWKWSTDLPAIPESARLTLGEGGTPLLHARRLGAELGLESLHLKIESASPSGSYKDRFAASAISHMLAAGESHCVASTSGNTGAALAAYCALAGMRCDIAVVETAPEDKLRQMIAYGARLVRIRSFGVDPSVTETVLDGLERIANRPTAAVQISAFRYSPLGMSGVQTISYELAAELDGIDHVFCPAGGGGLTLAVARGFAQLRAKKTGTSSPRVECVQPAGNDTIAGPLREGLPRAQAVQCATSISGLQVASVIDGDKVVEVCRDSGGTGHSVSDEAVWAMQARLARLEGVFSEPAGAVAVAGAAQARAAGYLAANAKVICLVTGSGFKDATSIARIAAASPIPTVDASELEATLEA